MAKYIKKYDNALCEDLCDRLIAKFNTDKRVKADPQPDYSTRRYVYTSDKADWAPLLEEVTEVANRLTANYFRSLGALVEEWFDDGYVFAHYREGDICALHDDNQSTQAPGNALRYATLLFYLNTVDGGETHFPNQSVRIKPVKGRAVMFPAMLTHPHEVFPPMGDRFIIQTWITDPYMEVNVRE